MKTPKKIVTLFLAIAIATSCLIPASVFADTENEEIRVSVQLTPDWEGHDLTITTVQNGEPVSAIATADDTGTVTFNVPSTDQYSVAVRGDEIAPADEILVSNIPGATLVEEGDVTFTLDLGPAWSGTVFSLYTTLDAYIRAFAADESGVVTLHANSSTTYDIIVATANDITDTELNGGTANEGETTTSSGSTSAPAETVSSGEDTLVGALGGDDENEYGSVPTMTTEGETNSGTESEEGLDAASNTGDEEESGGIDLVMVGTIMMGCVIVAIGIYAFINHRRKQNDGYDDDDDDDIYDSEYSDSDEDTEDGEETDEEEEYEKYGDDEEYEDDNESEYSEEEPEDEKYEEEYEDYEEEQEQYEEEEEEYEEPEPEPVKKPAPRKQTKRQPADEKETRGQDTHNEPNEDIFETHPGRTVGRSNRARENTESIRNTKENYSTERSGTTRTRESEEREYSEHTARQPERRSSESTERRQTTQRQPARRTQNTGSVTPIEEALREPVKRPTHQSPPRRQVTDDDDEWD